MMNEAERRQHIHNVFEAMMDGRRWRRTNWRRTEWRTGLPNGQHLLWLVEEPWCYEIKPESETLYVYFSAAFDDWAVTRSREKAELNGLGEVVEVEV